MKQLDTIRIENTIAWWHSRYTKCRTATIDDCIFRNNKKALKNIIGPQDTCIAHPDERFWVWSVNFTTGVLIIGCSKRGSVYEVSPHSPYTHEYIARDALTYMTETLAPALREWYRL